jgi:photosystem II stability/assembly factor-like uncharacterized protein
MNYAAILWAACFAASTLYAQNFWERTSSPGGYVGEIAISPGGHLFASSYLMGLFRSEDDGDSWTKVNEGLGTITNIGSIVFEGQDGRVLVAGNNGSSSQHAVLRSTNNGTSWSVVSGASHLRVGVLAINSSGHLFAEHVSGGGHDTLFRSTNGGESWKPTGLTGRVYSLDISANGDIFACSGPNVYRSNDNGDTWTNVRPDSVGGNYGSVAFNAAGTVFLTEYEPSEVGMYSRIWRSTNKGETWSIVRPWTFGILKRLAVNSRGHVFAGGWYVIRSTNDGMTWEDVSSGLQGGIFELAVSSEDRIFACGGAVYRSTRTATSAGEGESATGFALAQNYPNPFNPSTKIKFSIPVGTGHAPSVLKVYDILGREVRTLVDENLQPGSYDVTFDATGLASGVYLYRLQAGEFSQTKRLLLLR